MKKIALMAALAFAALIAAPARPAHATDPFAPKARPAARADNADPFAPKAKAAAKKAAVVPAKVAITVEQARAAFAWMKEQDDIAFRYVQDGCYARAHLMIKRLQAMGLAPGKVWALAGEGGMYVETPYGEHEIAGRKVQKWGWHCAPSLKVRTADGNLITCVIDPSLFDGPVSLETWKKALRPVNGDKAIRFVETKFGEPPLKEHGGAGYLLTGEAERKHVADADEHAVATMRKYLAKQPAAVKAES